MTIIERGCTTQEEREDVAQLYEVYTDLGGNGAGARLYEQATAIKTACKVEKPKRGRRKSTKE